MAALDANALKSRAQETLRRFTGPQLVIIVLLTVFGLVGSVMFLRWVSAPTYQVLIAGMEGEDAAAVTEKLKADGVPYQLADAGSTVLVPAAQVDATRIAIAAAGLPKGSTRGSYEAFDKLGFGASSFQQQVARQRAFEADLSATVGQVEGVESATVHLALPEQTVFAKERKPARASVMLETSSDVSDETVDAVVHLVASSVPDLEPGAVTVTDTSGRLLTGDNAAGSTGGTEKALKLQRSYEDVLTADATSMLEQVLGPGRAVVRVNAEIDTSQKKVDSKVLDKNNQVLIGENTETEELTGSGATTNPGGILTVPPTGAESGTGDYTKESAARQWQVGETVTSQQFGPGSIKRLTVSVAVDRNAATAPPASEITAMVANAVGLNADRGDAISITRAVFPKPEALEAPAEEAPAGLVATAPKLLTTGVAVVLLLLVGLGFLKALRRVQVTEIDLTDQALALPMGSQPAPAALGAADERMALPAARDAHDDAQILKLVEQQPDEVASLLRSWLAESSVKA